MNFSKRIFFVYITILFNVFIAYGQHQDLGEKPGIWKGNKTTTSDTSSLLHAFKSGHVEGHFRYFFSHTNNNEGLTDYYANAAGGGLRFETGRFHGFQVGVSGFYIFNLGSSDLARKDETTNQTNRYEIGLFDIENPNNKDDIDRLEEFFVKYNYGQSFMKFGRQLINTPFINLQDGRMRPSGVEGLWIETNEIKNLRIEGGWLYAMAPRSTVSWYRAANSVGVYPMGVNVDGSRSNYKDNIQSEGVLLLGAEYNNKKWLTLKLWDVLFENVLNTNLLQADVKLKVDNSSTIFAGLQFIHQRTIADGGNQNQMLTYAEKNSSASVIGSQLGWKNKDIELSANYTHIFDQGRYLMPREWGRDPFYTFMPRERNEGLGDVDALVGKLVYNFSKYGLKLSTGYGYFRTPDVANYALNKYGLPSYTQFNIDVKYGFKGLLKGLDGQLLIVAKNNRGNIYDDQKYEFNKVNLQLYNFVLNYHF
jgi:hypothetical protein